MISIICGIKQTNRNKLRYMKHFDGCHMGGDLEGG